MNVLQGTPYISMLIFYSGLAFTVYTRPNVQESFQSRAPRLIPSRQTLVFALLLKVIFTNTDTIYSVCSSTTSLLIWSTLMLRNVFTYVGKTFTPTASVLGIHNVLVFSARGFCQGTQYFDGK